MSINNFNSIPLVSVGMPLYNGAGTVCKALSSILAQRYANLEIIISDDGSTDVTVSICREMTAGDSRVKIYVSDRNRGALWNFNNTFRLSHGKYFMWAAQDDMRDPAYVEKCVNLLEKDNRAVLCHSYYADVIESTGNIKCIRNLNCVAGIDDTYKRFISSYKSGIGSTSFYGLMRSDALRRTRLWENYLGSDVSLFNELALYGKFLQVPEVLFWYFGRKAVRSPSAHFQFLNPDNKYPRIYLPFAGMAYKHLGIINRAPVPCAGKLYLWAWILLYESWVLSAKIIYKAASIIFGKKRASKILIAAGLGGRIPMETGYEDVRKSVTSVCRICGNSEQNRLYNVEEIMLGTKDIFNYLKCGSCGTLQIKDIPDDMSRYYKESYAPYGHKTGTRLYLSKRGAVHQWRGFCLIGWAQVMMAGRNIAIDAIKRAEVKEAESILDVGCGSAGLLDCLYYLGFRSISGIDSFIPENAVQEEPFRVSRAYLKDINGKFNLVILNHVFEHMTDPAETMREIEKHLNEHGKAIILVPVSDCYAWEEFKSDWVQIDAPRHIFLHTRAGMKILCDKAGLIIEDVLYDSSEFQIVGSKQCRERIPLVSARSIYSGGIANRIKLLMTKAILSSRVSDLNRTGAGDQACFIVSRKR